MKSLTDEERQILRDGYSEWVKTKKEAEQEVESFPDVNVSDLMKKTNASLTDQGGKTFQMSWLKTTPHDMRDIGDKTKIADLKFQAFINFLEDSDFSTEEFLATNNIALVLMKAPDALFGDDQIFDEEYKDKERGAVAAFVTLDDQGNPTENLAQFKYEAGKFSLSQEGDYMAQPVPFVSEASIKKFDFKGQANFVADRLGVMPQSEIDKLKSGKKESQAARDKSVSEIETKLRQQARDLLKARGNLSAPITLSTQKLSPGADLFYKRGEAKLDIADLFDSSGNISENIS